MSVQTIKIENEEQWLGERVKDITSTDIAALFALSPYKTMFELYHEKRDGQIVRLEDNPRMKWGRRFEAPIAYGVAEDQGWNIAKMDVYMRDPEARIGSSFDFQINSESDGPGIMEIKNVAELQYKRSWLDDEAPEHIELQIQHQMAVSGMKWTALVAMVGGNDPKVLFRQYDPDIGNAIRAKAQEFWQMVDKGKAPSADYTRDADIINRLYAQVNQGEIYDAQADDEIATMVSEYQKAERQIDRLEEQRKACKARIFERIGTAEKVIGPWGSISCTRTKDTPPKIITPEMVGTAVGGRSGYRTFRVNMKKEEANV